MKNSLLFAAGALLLASSCTNKQYCIEGPAFEELQGKTVYLRCLESDKKYVDIDSTVIDEKGFTFTGKADSAFIAIIATAEKELTLPVVVENKCLNVLVSEDGSRSVGGSALNDSLYKYEIHAAASTAELRRIINDIMKLTAVNDNQTEIDSLGAIYDSINILRTQFNSEFVVRNNQNPVGAYVLYSSLIGESGPRLDSLMQGASASFMNTAYAKICSARIDILKRSEKGAMFTDFRMNNIEGQEVALSDYVGKGKYVFLDFWASWCSPCCRELPNVLEAYNKYSSKGLEIVGVSFDRSESDWKAKVEEMKLPWIHLSDLKGWDSEAGRTYGIRSIPSTILFDPQGKVVASNLRGEELQQALAEIFK